MGEFEAAAIARFLTVINGTDSARASHREAQGCTKGVRRARPVNTGQEQGLLAR